MNMKLESVDTNIEYLHEWGDNAFLLLNLQVNNIIKKFHYLTYYRVILTSKSLGICFIDIFYIRVNSQWDGVEW